MNQLSEKTAKELTESFYQISQSMRKSNESFEMFSIAVINHQKAQIIKFYSKIMTSYFVFDWSYPLNRFTFLLFKSYAMKRMIGLMDKCNSTISKL